MTTAVMFGETADQNWKSIQLDVGKSLRITECT